MRFMKLAAVVLMAIASYVAFGEKVALSTTNDKLRYLGIGGSTAITTQEFTMEAWVKPTAVRAEMPIVTQYPGNGRIIFGLRVKSDDKSKAVLDFFVGDYSGWQTSGYVVPLNEWTHVAVVRGVRTFDLFANGEKVYSYTYTKDYPAPPAMPLTVGGYVSSLERDLKDTTSYHAFVGGIADVRVWNCKRTDAEIAGDKDRRLTGGEAGLIAYWPLNESLGNTTPEYVQGADSMVTDIWSIQEDASFSLTSAVGRRAPAPAWPVFCGFRADKSSLNTELSLPPQTDFTFEVWINPTNEAVITENRIAAQYSQVAGDNGGRMLFELYEGKPALFQGNSNPKRPMTDEALPLNTWTHVACVRKYAGKQVLFYTNGVLAASYDCTTVNPLPANTNLFVFGCIPKSDPHFIGCLRDLRVWTTARTEEEIAANFQRELTGEETGLFAYWPLDDGGQTFHELVNDRRYGWSVSGFTWLDSKDVLSRVPYLQRSADKVLQPCFGGDLATGGDTGVGLPTDTTAYTLEAWICPRGVSRLSSTENRILYQYTDNKDAGRMMFGLYQNRLYFLQGSVNHKSSGQIKVDGNTWSHVAAVRNGKSIALYINGEQVESFQATDEGHLSDANITIACKPGAYKASGDYTSFNGGLREIRVWTVARTAAEIKRNYNRTLTGEEPGLFGYWPIDNSATDLKTLTNKRVGAADGNMRAMLLPLPPFPTLKDPSRGCVILVR